MRVLVISDVHSNLTALQAVLDDAGEVDITWSLGDIVGYGPEPNECIQTLQSRPHVAVAGNHDWGVLGKLDLADFNEDARIANLWNREQLTFESLAYLQALPEKRIEGVCTLTHGSPRHPIWEYVISTSVADANFAYFDTPICLVGHTHVPILFRQAAEDMASQAIYLPEFQPVQLDDARYIINPGGVGQPRDGDPRAAYLLLDTEELIIEHRRVAYDIAATQAKMRAVGLPRRNISRLEVGW
ncbi:MAG: metallophosphoesterase family protein [Chloroflexi bacterium]|nr:metallophosphoesterase family protein [Chloroflexota bacterium]